MIECEELNPKYSNKQLKQKLEEKIRLFGIINMYVGYINTFGIQNGIEKIINEMNQNRKFDNETIDFIFNEVCRKIKL